MEDWQIEFEWLRVRHQIKASFNKDVLPDMQAILFLIGLQELGQVQKKAFTKEEKQDLMHIAVCTLLEEEGYYAFEGRDHDGWPHWKVLKVFTKKGIEDQEEFLKLKVIEYFRSLDKISNN
jgi:hypothetical protein